MGKLTDVLKKAASERMSRLDKISHITGEHHVLVVKKVGDSKVDPRIVSYFDSKSLATEQYKILRTNLLSIHKKTPLKKIVITSSLHSEGKTITALNLAITLAQATQKPKVLFIDADMRKGKVHKYLGVNPSNGLSEVLLEKVKLEEALFQIDINNLSFIACGAVPTNPSELLQSEQMVHLLEHLQKEYTHIIIDTPPIIPVTDAGLVGAHSDGVLMIIQAGRTQRGIVKRAVELLHQSQAKIIGHVLTNIEYHLPEYIYRYL